MYLLLALFTGQPVPIPPVPVAVIGGEKPGSEVLGIIQGIAIDRYGRIAVLDAAEKRIAVFRGNGTRIQYLGRKGDGPGEFRSPIGMAVTSNKLYVGDAAAARVTIYDVSRPDSVRLVGTSKLRVSPSAICASQNSVTVLAETEQHLIHDIDVSGPVGKIVRSYGRARTLHTLGTALPAAFWLSGTLACDSGGTNVAVTADQLGEVRLFDGAREEHWLRAVPDFVPIEITLAKEGWRNSVPKNGYFNVVTALIPDLGGGVTLQVATLYPRDDPRRETPSYRTFRLDTQGKVVRSAPGSLRLHAISADRIVCSRQSPVPEVLIYTRTATLDACP